MAEGMQNGQHIAASVTSHCDRLDVDGDPQLERVHRAFEDLCSSFIRWSASSSARDTAASTGTAVGVSGDCKNVLLDMAANVTDCLFVRAAPNHYRLLHLGGGGALGVAGLVGYDEASCGPR
jgi:hypothetical protein